MRRLARAARRLCDSLWQYVTFCDGSVTFNDARAAGGGRRAAGVAWRACAARRARHGGAVTFCYNL